MKYRSEIDGLRAVAVIPVVLFHGNIPIFSGGFVGVDVFFVISGYLISTILITEMEAGTFSIVKFYERRARRILPALFLVIGCSIPFAWFLLLPSQLVDFGESIAATMVFASNVLFWRETNYFTTGTDLKPLLHTWSLAVEEQFYVIFPFVLLIFSRLGHRNLWLLIFLAAGVSLALAEYMSIRRPTPNFYLLPSRVWELLAGAFCAMYLMKERPSHNWIGWLGLVLILFSVATFDKNTPFPSIYTVIPVLGAVLIILNGRADSGVGWFLSRRILIGIGLISYSVYLWHQPTFAFSKIWLSRELGPLHLLGLIPLILTISYLSWRFVERPFRYQYVVSRRSVFSVAVLGSVLLAGLGMSARLGNGFVERYAPEDRNLASLNLSEISRYYVRRNAVQRSGREFPDNNKRNVMIIGDSYSQDFTNVLIELGADLNISTHFISKECGNVYVNYDVSKFVPSKSTGKCLKTTRYNENVLNLLKKSDFVVLASSWEDWVIDHLPETISNIKKITKNPIIVVGRKYFGATDIRSFLNMTSVERTSHRTEVLQDIQRLSDRVVSIDNYLDLFSVICDGYLCPAFTNEGRLISTDGTHLTPEGARYLGRKLSEESPLFRMIVNK